MMIDELTAKGKDILEDMSKGFDKPGITFRGLRLKAILLMR
jgi:hypothetical protein